MPNDRIEQVLNALLPLESVTPTRLHQAMRYACLGGGKRLRAQLVYASGVLFNLSQETLDPAAAAVEMVHAYSLIHDDLPAMDNDTLRRGKPTVHIAFDEATAVLAGDALQTTAFSALTHAPWPQQTALLCLNTLLHASGSLGMCGGQQLDMDASGQWLALPDLQRVHAMKTGALIKAAVLMPAHCGQANADQYAALNAFADDLGLAFQIRDDILDVESNTETLGKSSGKDAAQAKATYTSVMGMAAAKTLLAELDQRMPQHLALFGAQAEPLMALARFAVQRQQ